MPMFDRPYHLYPLLGLVFLAVAIGAIAFRLRRPPRHAA